MDFKFNQKVLTLEMQIQELSLQKYLSITYFIAGKRQAKMEGRKLLN